MTRKLLPVWITLFSILLLGAVAWRASAASTAVLSATSAAVTIEESLPDLVITDVWNEGDLIWYQIWNAGDATALAGHVSRLWVDGGVMTGHNDTIGVDLAPGERLKRSFTRGWVCGSPQDTIEVCADFENNVSEGNETNNCREEIWPCDTVPPQITSGPVVSTTTTTTATVFWQTDEDSNSVVRYGKQAGIYALEEQDSSLVQMHPVTLTGLEPSTIYHYVVQSTDPSSNTVVSKEGFFETAPLADSEPPTISSFQVTHLGKEQYEFAAEASDNIGVERIEFYLDGELVGIDYTPSSPYRVPLAPSRLDVTREEFYAPHTATAVAVDRNGLSDQLNNPFAPADEEMDVSTTFRAPTSDYTIHTADATVPPGTFVEIEVHAVQYVWECRYVPDPRGGFEFCADRAQDVTRVEFYVDGDLKHTSNFPQTRHIHHYDWDAGGLSVDTQHTISVTVVASDGGEHHPTPPRTVSIVSSQPHIWVRRTVSRIDNCFDITLTVGNSGLASAEMTQIRDNLSGFQPISRTEGTEYAVSAAYDPNTMLSSTTIDFFAGKTIAPGENLEVAYLAVPILHPDLEDDAYAIGGEQVSVSYIDSAGSQVETLDLPCQVTSDGELLAEAVGLAVREADYLIVTNPTYLFFFNANNDDVNALLSTMAHLAQLKAGVLGHLTEEHRNDPDSGRAQIREWGSVMKREDGTPNGYLYSGYLLIVGESEIVGSYVSKHKTGYSLWTKTRHVRWTDLPYGNTAGKIEDPELAVGRIIGNDAKELAIPLQTSINVYLRETGFEFDRSDALAISGPGPGAITFERNMERVAEILEQEFSSVVKIKWREVGDFSVEFRQHDADKDVIFYRDHCGPNSWSGGINTGDFAGDDAIDFANSKPFVFACCCQAGQYEDDGENGIAEAFSKQGAAVYIGATEISIRDPNNRACKWVFSRWTGRSRSIGQQLKEVKRQFDGFEGHYWGAEYNLYGDPKYGSDTTVGPLAAAAAVTTTPPVSTTVIVPDYLTATIDGEDHVEIPEGGILLEPGEPVVPIYATNLVYPADYRVQAVTLVERSGLITSTGLHIPTYTAELDEKAMDEKIKSAAHSQETEWSPDKATFEWQVSEMPDGSSILTIRMYPFRYNPLTTDVKFYKNYDFEIEYITSTVAIEELTTDQYVYAQGDTVHTDFYLHNTGEPQDVLVSAVVTFESSDEAADGLLLQNLHALNGDAFFSTQWDSAGFEPGYYAIEATIRDSDGSVLDKETRRFRLGIYAGEVITFTAEPETFETGDTITASMVFSNTGTVPLTGTAIIQVQNGTGEIVEQFDHSFGNLAPANSVSFNDGWDTSGVASDSYTVLGYVLYDAKSTAPQSAVVSNQRRVYLPLVIKD